MDPGRQTRTETAAILTAALKSALHSFGLAEGPARHAADVAMEVAVPEEDADRLTAAFVEATAGRIEVAEGG